MNREDREAAAKLWGAAGRAYDEMSFMVSDALAHAAQRLQVQRAEAVLDVATGTGWTARNLARCGAEVTAIDVAEEMIAGAMALSTHVYPPIAFRHGDAEDMPFADGQFDAVASTFGVMFAPDPQQAASEMARVCRPGGRLALLSWQPTGSVADFFVVTSKYSSEPPPEPSPLLWGDPDHVTSLLGEFFDLTFETGISRSYHPDGEQITELYARCSGPVKTMLASLDEKRAAQLRQDLVDLHERYRGDAGLCIERPYLLVLGTRR